MTQRPWNTGEIRVLKEYAGLGCRSVAILLERSQTSVQAKAKEMRISMQVTGDDVEIQNLTEKILGRIREVPELNICPVCGLRLATMHKTGICRPCHLDALIALRESQLAEEIRLRRLQKIRQDKARLRICPVCNSDFYPRAGSKMTRCERCGGRE